MQEEVQINIEGVSKGLKTIEKEDGIYIKTQKKRKIARHH